MGTVMVTSLDIIRNRGHVQAYLSSGTRDRRTVFALSMLCVHLEVSKLSKIIC